MYDDLVKRLWECASGECFNCSQFTETTNASVCSKELMKQAADAIETLQQQVEHYHGCMNDWFEAAQEYKAAYIAEHDARIAECERKLTEKEQEAHNAFLTMATRCG
jgi:exonuclease V gamma subunit